MTNNFRTLILMIASVLCVVVVKAQDNNNTGSSMMENMDNSTTGAMTATMANMTDMKDDDEGHGDDHGHGDDDHGDGEDIYCAIDCKSTPEDPCGDKMGQTSGCLAIGGDTFMVGCSLTACAKLCEGEDDDMSSSMDMKNDTTTMMDSNMNKSTMKKELYCFKKSGSNMFMKESMAEISAVSRGCAGSHTMQDNMFMIGASHIACESSYTKEGITFTGKAMEMKDDGHDHDHGSGDNNHHSEKGTSAAAAAVSSVLATFVVAIISFLH